MKNKNEIYWDMIAIFAGLGLGYLFFLKKKNESIEKALVSGTVFGVRG